MSNAQLTAPSELAKKNSSHWCFIDSMKGVLLILVFVGHLIPYALEESLTRHIIYTFHMPLFVSISGFLFNVEKVQIGFKDFFKKYGKRMLLPWFIAVVIYYFFNNLYVLEKELTLELFFRRIYSPYYHLWYIIGAVGYIGSSLLLWKLVKKFKHRWGLLFSIALAFAVISQYRIIGLYHYKLAVAGIVDAWVPEALKILHIDFKPFNYPMFVFGMLLRNMYEHGRLEKLLKLTPLWIALLAVITAIDVKVFEFQSDDITGTVYQVMSYPMLLIILRITLSAKPPRIRIMEFIGQYSLPIYLYHVICIRIAEKQFGKGTDETYILACVLFAVLLLLVYVLKKVPFVNRYLFGSTNSFLQKK